MTTALVIVGIWLMLSVATSFGLAGMLGRGDEPDVDLDAELAMLTSEALSSRRGS